MVDDNSLAACSIKLVGGGLLPWVDVTVTIRPSRRVSPLRPEPLGPYRWANDLFDTEYQNQWITKPFRLLHGDDVFLTMRAVAAGPGINNPVRLMLDCTTEGGAQWLVPISTRLIRLEDA